MNKLTSNESYVVNKILEEAKRSLKWDKEQKEYLDDGSFIMSLDKSEMTALTKAIRKI